MSIGLNMTQARSLLVERQENFKMNELGDEQAITIGQDNQIVKAEIISPPKDGQLKPHKANTGLEGLFKATIDKCDWWHSAGKLRRAQDAIEVNLGRMAGKFVNLHTLAGKSGLSDDIAGEKTLLTQGIAKELSAFKSEIDILVRSYGLPRESTELSFLQRLINSLKNKEKTDALNSLKAAVAVEARMPDDNPVMRDHAALLTQFDTLLHDNMPDVVAEPVEQRTGLQKLGDTFSKTFGTKEEKVRNNLRDKLNGLEQLCKTYGNVIPEFTDRLRSKRESLKPDTELTMENFDSVREELDSIIGETIKRGKEIAEKALEMESAKMPGQLPVDKYQPQLASAEEANRDLSKLFLSKNMTVETEKSSKSSLDEMVDDLIRSHGRDQTKSLESPQGARAVAQIAVNKVNDMTLKFVAARQELKGIGAELSAITLAKQLAAKGDTPPEGVDANTWREDCDVMTRHLIGAPAHIFAGDKGALARIKANEATFTEGLEGVAVERFKKLFTRLDVSTPFTVTVPRPSQQQIDEFKQTGEELMRKNAERFKEHMQEWQNPRSKTDISELDRRLAALRTPLTLNSDKLDEASLRLTLAKLEGLIEDIKLAYSYETAAHLSCIDKKDRRLERQTELFAALKTELQGLMRMQADLQGMISMRVTERVSVAIEGLVKLSHYCPEGTDPVAWKSDCNAIDSFIMENPNDIPDIETVATFERLLNTLNNFPSTDTDAHERKVKLYKSLKDDLNLWKNWGFTDDISREGLNNLGHMDDVRDSVSSMTTALIRIGDVINLMQDSFISLTKAGFGVSHAEELRSNLHEYSSKLMAYADTVSRGNDAGVALKLSEAQESLSKTIHSFFPAMQFLAEQEHLYKANPAGFTLAQAQQVRDLRATMFNAYEAIFDIGRNVSTLGLEASLVSTLHGTLDLTQQGEGMSVRDYYKDTSSKESEKVEQSSSNNVSSQIESIMLDSEAQTKDLIKMNYDQHITKFFILTQRLTTALAEAKAKGLDPAIASSIELLFSEHVMSPGKYLALDNFITDNKKASDFENNFSELDNSLRQTLSSLQFHKLNVKSTQTRINRQAQEYLQKNWDKNLSVVASHDSSGIMSRILIKMSPNEKPHWYKVDLENGEVTFTPADDKKGKKVIPVSNGKALFPMVQTRMSLEAQEYLHEHLKQNLTVLDSHVTDGMMSRIFIQMPPEEKPRWYKVVPGNDKVTITPAEGKKDKEVTVPVWNGKALFPMVQTPINFEAQKYLREHLKQNLTVLASDVTRGIMSSILIQMSPEEKPRWYDVSAFDGRLDFVPTDDKSGKCITAPVSNGKVLFPMVQTPMSLEAQKYLQAIEYLDKNLKVLASHDISGRMSGILIESKLTKEPRWYDVSLSEGNVTFTPTDDKSGSGVLTVPFKNGGARFPIGETKKASSKVE